MVDRVRVTWSGFPGGPGLSTFYVTSGAAAVGPISSMFAGFRNQLPMDVSYNVPGSGDAIDPITGLISGSWAGGTPTPGSGGGSGGYSAPAGALIRWATGGIVRGHRVKGRTFLVPIVASSYQADGTLIADALTMIQNAASGLVAALPTDLFVFSRPSKGSPAWTDVHGKLHPLKPPHVGGVFAVTSAIVPDQSVVLRSRRD